MVKTPTALRSHVFSPVADNYEMNRERPARVLRVWLITALSWGVLFTITALTVDGLSKPYQAQMFLLEGVTIYLSLFTVWRIKKPLPEDIEAASRDELTGLASRAAFMRAVQNAIAASSRKSELIAVLFLDFDNFKRLNDTLGHAAGDRLLIEASRRLSSIVRNGELFARLGGDEFTFLLRDVKDSSKVRKVADRVVATMNKPFVINGHEVVVTASIGISLNIGSRLPADELVRRADVALYKAKAAGRDCWRMYDGDESSASVEYLEVGSKLRAAIETNQLRLFFQPTMDLTTGRISGMEALVRWQHPTRGLLGPSAFIPIAEESGSIRGIGEWVLRAACIEAARWVKQFPSLGDAILSVNVSPQEFSQGLLDNVRDALERSGLPASRLRLEITETALMQDVNKAMDLMLRLKVLGVRLSIDDFGTGYSSLSYLRHFPVDSLKIDQSFVSQLDKDAKVIPIVRATVGLAHALELAVTAEGVETPDQLDALVEMGCDEGQGYLFSRPLPLEALMDFLEARKASEYEQASVA